MFKYKLYTVANNIFILLYRSSQTNIALLHKMSVWNKQLNSATPSDKDKLFKCIRNDNAELLKDYLDQNEDLRQNICSCKDNLTTMSMLRYSIDKKSFDCAGVILDYCGDDLFDKERYLMKSEAGDVNITFIHLLIDEEQRELIVKFFERNKEKGDLLLSYIELKRKCFMKGLRTNVDFEDYLSSFEYAIYRQQPEIALLFSERFPSLMDSCQCNLQYAVLSKDHETFETILDHIRRNRPDWYNWSNMYEITKFAVQYGFAAVVETCFQHLQAIEVSRIQSVHSELLLFALVEKQDNIACLLIDWGAIEETALFDEQSIITLAAGSELNQVVKKLTEIFLSSKKPNFEHSFYDILSSLEIAANNEDQIIIEILLDSAKENDVKLSELFWNIVVSKNEQFCTAIYRKFDCLFEAENIVIIMTENKTSALHIAAQMNSVESVAFFQKYGVSFELANEDGNTPLHCAASTEAPSVVDFLVENYANVNAKNNAGQTPLHLACQCGGLEAIKNLLDSGNLDLSLQDDSGCTALHYYVQSLRNISPNKLDVLGKLCKAFSKNDYINAINGKKQTAFDILFHAGIEEGLKYFRMSHVRDCNELVEQAVLQFLPKTTLLVTLIETFEKQMGSHSPFAEKLADTSKDYFFHQPVYRNVVITTTLHLFASSLNESLVKKVLINGANVFDVDENGDTVFHVLADLSILNKDREADYVNMAKLIMTTFLGKVYQKLSLKGEDGKKISDNCRLLFIFLTRILVNDNLLSVIIHAADKKALHFMEFLLQFKLSLRDYSLDLPDETLDFSPDVTALCQETMPFIDYSDLLNKISRSLCSRVQVQIPKTISYKPTEFLLDVIVNLPDDAENDCIQMLNFEPITRLIRGYSRGYTRLYYIFLFVHIFLMLLLFLCIWLDDEVLTEMKLLPEISKCEVNIKLTLLGPFIWMFALFTSFLRIHRIRKYKNGAPLDKLWTVLSLTFAVLTFCWWICVLTCSLLQPYFVALSVFLGWTLVISYMQAIRQLHVFTNIIAVIITKDVSWFSIIFIIFIMAMWCSLAAIVTYPPQMYANSGLLYQALYLTMNMGDFLDYHDVQEKDNRILLIQLLYVTITTITAVILLNVLIAMMNDSYRRVVDKKYLSWRTQSLRETVHLKRTFPAVFTIRCFSANFLPVDITYEQNKLRMFSVIDIKVTTKKKAIMSMTENELKSGLDEVRAQMMRLEHKVDLLLNMQMDPVKAKTYNVFNQWKAKTINNKLH